MRKRRSGSSVKRPSRFVTAFGVLLGLICVGYGAGMLLFHPAGIGPCGRHCGIEQALLSLLGQPLYNLIVGLAWTAAGLSLIVLLSVLRARRR